MVFSRLDKIQNSIHVCKMKNQQNSSLEAEKGWPKLNQKANGMGWGSERECLGGDRQWTMRSLLLRKIKWIDTA